VASIILSRTHLRTTSSQLTEPISNACYGSWRGNAWNLSEKRQEQRKSLCRQYTKLGRAMSLRKTLQAILREPEPPGGITR